ncbi:hypothetical protein [Rhodopseudomonas palustris]|uniref:hypothetical protein n=1 Tax=Rhodopseudomonas palustris TaxID=1076 RepID=UPI001F1B9C0B|nr:hypothetical protein [Rhodopseudomonas palustris]
MNLSAAHLASQASVMAGLDPAIHPASQKRLSKTMDHRGKPGGDSHQVEMPS